MQRTHKVNIKQTHKQTWQSILRPWASPNTFRLVLFSLLLRLDHIPSETPLEKKLLFANIYQLEIISKLNVGACVHVPSEHWDLCRPCACCRSLWKSLCALLLPCLECLVSLVSSISSGSCSLSTASSIGFPDGRDLMKLSHLVLSVPNFVTLGTWFSCRSLYSTLRGSFSADDWVRHCPMSIAECHYKPFIAVSLVVLGFPQLHALSSFRFFTILVVSRMGSISWSRLIKYCLVTPTSFMLLLHWCALQAGHHVDGKTRSWVGVHLSPLVECWVPSSTKDIILSVCVCDG